MNPWKRFNLWRTRTRVASWHVWRLFDMKMPLIPGTSSVDPAIIEQRERFADMEENQMIKRLKK